MPQSFSLSPVEIIIILLAGFLCLGFVAALVVLVVALTRRKERFATDEDLAKLEAENRRLREEVRRRNGNADASRRPHDRLREGGPN